MKDYSLFLDKSKVTIFLLHGVIKEHRYRVRNYTRKHISEQEFLNFIETVSIKGNAISLDYFIDCESHENLPEYAYVVTFDDGFKNNLTNAAPILSSYKIPSTFYITTGFVLNNQGSWIDLIEARLENTSSFNVENFHPNFDGKYSNTESMTQFLDKIRVVVKNDLSIDPYKFASELVQKIKPGTVHYERELDEMLSVDDIRSLDNNPLFTIGGHGHTHRLLSSLERVELEFEIKNSINIIEKIVGHKIRHYSYPEGLEHCFNNQVIECLKTNGIECAPSALPGLNSIDDDKFHLKRVFI